jgi:hypothetical protein
MVGGHGGTLQQLQKSEQLEPRGEVMAHTLKGLSGFERGFVFILRALEASTG